MKYLSIFAALLSSCTTTPPTSPEQRLAGHSETCLILSATMVESLRRQGVDADTVIYRAEDRTDPAKSFGHAVTAYLYPTGKNRLWTHDQLGSFRCRAYRNDPLGIAQQAELTRGRSWNRIISATFIGDLPETEFTPVTPP